MGNAGDIGQMEPIDNKKIEAALNDLLVPQMREHIISLSKQHGILTTIGALVLLISKLAEKDSGQRTSVLLVPSIIALEVSIMAKLIMERASIPEDSTSKH